MAQVISGLGSSDIQDCALDKKSAFTSVLEDIMRGLAKFPSLKIFKA